MTIPYTEEQSSKAWDDWQASCGPHCIAVACQRSLDDVRQAIPNYRGFMNPTQILKTLFQLKQGFRYHKDVHLQKVIPDSPHPQILRIQFEGSWLNAGVPVGAAYKHTHYIAVDKGKLMDPMIDPSHIMDVEWWISIADEMVKDCIPKSTGWHFTHAWEIHPIF